MRIQNDAKLGAGQRSHGGLHARTVDASGWPGGAHVNNSGYFQKAHDSRSRRFAWVATDGIRQVLFVWDLIFLSAAAAAVRTFGSASCASLSNAAAAEAAGGPILPSAFGRLIAGVGTWIVQRRGQPFDGWRRRSVDVCQGFHDVVARLALDALQRFGKLVGGGGSLGVEFR